MAASDARALANSLAAFDDAQLARLLTERRVPASATWGDFFDAADALLDPASILRGLAALTRDEVDALDAVDTDHTVLRDHGMASTDGELLAAVVDVRRTLDAAAPQPPVHTEPTGDEVLAERAFDAAASLADILDLTTVSPLGRIGSGALSAADRRRLIDLRAARDPDDADELLAIAQRAGLLVAHEREWRVTGEGAAWLHSSTVTRWQAVAHRLRATLPDGVRDGAGWLHPDRWPDAYPLDPQWPAQADHLRALLRRWGMIGADGAPPAWGAGLAAGTDADLDALQLLLPAEVDKVFLQNDLTAIAPGPLEPQLDMRLRSMAHRETRAQASTYRFTSDSLGAALTAGETAASMRAFLETLSLTGLPQPLAYEIDRSATRHGGIRIGPDWSGRTRITSDDHALLEAVGVDQALRPLGLVRDGDALMTGTSPDTAFWMLADARYPVLAVDADGQPRRLDRQRLADPQPVDAGGDYAPLIARLRAAHAQDADAAWLERELEQAVRARATLVITVQLPDGSSRDVTLEATGLGGGRLRGRDAAADVERTLPVRSISAVRPA